MGRASPTELGESDHMAGRKIASLRDADLVGVFVSTEPHIPTESTPKSTLNKIIPYAHRRCVTFYSKTCNQQHPP